MSGSELICVPYDGTIDILTEDGNIHLTSVECIESIGVRRIIQDAMELFGQFTTYPDDGVEESCHREGNFEKREQYCEDRRKEVYNGRK